MKLIYHIIICFLGIIISHNIGNAQTYSNGLFSLKSGIDYSFTELNLEGEVVKYKVSSTSSYSTVSIKDIDVIQTVEGNYASRYALFGGLTGLVGSSLGVWQANSDLGNFRDNSTDGAIIGGITAVATLVGGLIGMNKKKYKRVYPSSNAVTKTWKPKFDFQDSRLVAGISFNF